MCQDELVRRFYEEVGRRLRRARTNAGLTQLQVAERVGLSRASIANIEAGRQQFPLHVLILLADALNVSGHELLPNQRVFVNDPSRLEADLIEGLDEESKKWVLRVLSPTEEATG
jgi:transcriptional regulator with XRE-family HTH domain